MGGACTHEYQLVIKTRPHHLAAPLLSAKAFEGFENALRGIMMLRVLLLLLLSKVSAHVCHHESRVAKKNDSHSIGRRMHGWLTVGGRHGTK